MSSHQPLNQLQHGGAQVGGTGLWQALGVFAALAFLDRPAAARDLFACEATGSEDYVVDPQCGSGTGTGPATNALNLAIASAGIGLTSGPVNCYFKPNPGLFFGAGDCQTFVNFFIANVSRNTYWM